MSENTSLENTTHIHFIGIGGCGISALAEMALARNYQVSGSDLHPSDFSEKLKAKSVPIFYDHKIENLAPTVNLVVRSAAISDKNIEVKEAQKRDLPVIKHAEFLGLLMEEKYGICVSGSHGKTTTDALIGLILKNADLNPNVEIGGFVKEFSGNCLIGDGRYFVAEACEFDHSFLHLKPNLVILLNIESDHPDYYSNMKSLQKAFVDFLNLVPKDGYIIANDESKEVQEVLKKTKSQAQIVTFGFHEKAEIQIIEDRYLEDTGLWHFQLQGFDKRQKNILPQTQEKANFFNSALPGRHNILNATATIIASEILGISLETVKSTLESFHGVSRRFELVDDRFGIKVYIDYAHHPSQIKETIKSVRRVDIHDLVVIFQPHTYSRTKALFSDFTKSFQKADKLYITDTYVPEGRREKKLKAYTSQELAKKIAKKQDQVFYSGNLENTILKVRENLNIGDLVLILGAGNVYEIAKIILNKD